MRWVYTSGSEKAPTPSAIKPVKPPASGGFFASLFSGLSGTSTTPQPPSTPVEVPKPADPLKSDMTSVSLTIFSAEADVRLDQKLAAELHRSTKKSVPKKIKYELIYVSIGFYLIHNSLYLYMNYRRGWMNIMPVNLRMSNKPLRRLVVFSKAYVPILMGNYFKFLNTY